MPPFRSLRRRFHKWVWGRIVTCCCVVEELERWESSNPDDWDDKLLAPWVATEHGDEYGHLVSLDIMRTWRDRGDYIRALKSEDLLAPGSMINQHPVLKICLGFRNCELAAGKDYSCYCRVRKIFRGKRVEDAGVEGKLDCEPVYDGMMATYWLECVDPMLSSLWDLSSTRHKRSNFSVKKFLTNDAIMSDPIHMMYVHIEGMIPQFGPFMFEVWRRNQGLQIGFMGDSIRHGVNIIIAHPRRQTLEAQLRQMFPNKPIRLRSSEQQNRPIRKGMSIIGESSSSIYVSTLKNGRLEDALKKPSLKVVLIPETGSATNVNQSAETSTKTSTEALIAPDHAQRETKNTTPRVDKVLLPTIPKSKRYSIRHEPQRNSLPQMLRKFVRRILGRPKRNRK